MKSAGHVIFEANLRQLNEVQVEVQVAQADEIKPGCEAVDSDVMEVEVDNERIDCEEIEIGFTSDYDDSDEVILKVVKGMQKYLLKFYR